MIKRILIALGIGIILTGALIVLAYIADANGFPTLAAGLFWQNTWLQSYAPLGNIGTVAHPVYEGTPLNLLAFLASIPLGIFVYSLLAYAGLTWVRHRA